MERRFSFLGFELYWMADRKGTLRVKRRTARKKLRAALNRHKPKRWFFKTLNAKLHGHYNYYDVQGNSRSLWKFYDEVMKMLFK